MSATSSSSSSGVETWIEYHVEVPGNEFLCEVDRRFVEDTFNLYGLRETVSHFKTCLDVILDRVEITDFNSSLDLQSAVADLYGLIHARFILTKRGQDKMYRKYKDSEFGVCPLLSCEAQSVLPVGLSDDLGDHSVLVYCPRCRQVLVPSAVAASRFDEVELDGAYFGTSFPHLFFMQNPHLLPPPPLQMEPYVPRIFGFKVRFPSEDERQQSIQVFAANAGQDSDGGGMGAAVQHHHQQQLLQQQQYHHQHNNNNNNNSNQRRSPATEVAEGEEEVGSKSPASSRGTSSRQQQQQQGGGGTPMQQLTTTAGGLLAPPPGLSLPSNSQGRSSSSSRGGGLRYLNPP